MQVRELSIAGAWEFTPAQHEDHRGLFFEAFKAEEVAGAIGHAFTLAQANTSVSAAGVIRGVHFADVPPGQAKYVTCPSGAVLDVVVDLRVGSPTFGAHDAVLLDDADRKAVYISEGLGHAFCSLQDGSTVTYLCSTGYNPTGEHGVSPLDEELGIGWPSVGRDGAPLELVLSEKDRDAPNLREAAEAGLLPRADRVEAYLRDLRG
ncbi:dTDP-4-dehydrorhamnose 3,5-epimerase [Gordonia caeni]|uniref:dTDP-4-dehydrorhamnose 3,5-epimerase n=1 Tax=Gordonia caeni TaxID=1007097 RepID=A0ABP7PPC1_9ACTN